ncbi:type IV secretion system DNA-binding domain-containing protein [Massilia forsythiae]|nr:type IV secretion system DNA-binding domain-containing protein [Massilia forsythiae]
MERREKTRHDLGAMPLVAPTAKRVGVSSWAFAGAALGAISGVGALALLWRPLPGLAAPPGELKEHAGWAMRWLIHQAFAPAFPDAAKGYASGLAGLAPAPKFALQWRACAAALCACLPAALLAPKMLKPRDGLTVLRGPARWEGDAAKTALRRRLAKRCAARPDHDLAPGIAYPADMWTRHMLVVAGTGAGKSTALKPLIEKVVKANERALIFDPKGEFTKGFGSPAILAPWDARSVAWDVAKDMRNIGDMRRLAAAFVKEAQDPMWSNAARQLLVGFMVYLKATRRDDWGWKELDAMSSAPHSDILPIMEEHHREAVRAVERASVTTQGILINLASFMSPVRDLAQAWGETPKSRRVSFVEWTHGRDERAQIILQGHGAYPDLAKSFLEGIVGVVAAIVNSVEMDDDPRRKIWFIADESAQMGKVPMRPLFDVGRSRGVRCVIACQDLGQLEEIHGDKTVKAIVAMAGSILLGQMMPGETSEQLCKALGSREVERANVSASVGAGSGRSTTLSFSRDEMPLYKPSELASRLGLTPDGRGVRMALCMGGDAYELFWPRFDIKNIRPAHVPAPWTRRFMFEEGAALEGKHGGEAASVKAIAPAPAAACVAYAPASAFHGESDPMQEGMEPLSEDDSEELIDLLDLVDELDAAPRGDPQIHASMPSLSEIEAMLARDEADAR